jgi:hypothetical protein
MFRCPLPPCITRLGFDCAGAGFAIGGQSAYLESMFEFCFPTKRPAFLTARTGSMK